MPLVVVVVVAVVELVVQVVIEEEGDDDVVSKRFMAECCFLENFKNGKLLFVLPPPTDVECEYTGLSDSARGVSVLFRHSDSAFCCIFSYSYSWPRKLKLGDMVGLLSLTYLFKY